MTPRGARFWLEVMVFAAAAGMVDAIGYLATGELRLLLWAGMCACSFALGWWFWNRSRGNGEK